MRYRKENMNDIDKIWKIISEEYNKDEGFREYANFVYMIDSEHFKLKFNYFVKQLKDYFNIVFKFC